MSLKGTLKKLTILRPVTLQDGLDGVRTGRYALLSDYISIYPFLTKSRYLHNLWYITLVTDRVYVLEKQI